MSDANSPTLNFACPKCQKNLRAPSKLAGQKLTCPKCSAPIRVPGVVETKNEDDDWLALDSPAKASTPAKSPSASPKQSSPTSKPSTSKPASKPPVPMPAATSGVDQDEFRLAAPETISKDATATSTPSPKPTIGKSVFDDDLPELTPMESTVEVPANSPKSDTSRTRKTAPSSSKSEMALPDISLPNLDLDDIPLAPIETPQSKSILTGSLEEIMLDSPALIGSAAIDDEEFSFPCKLCGSLLGSSRSRVGSPTRCPDCYSEFSVPSPPPKKKIADVKLDADVARVTFAPIDSLSVHGTNSSSEKTKEILDKAQQTIETEREEFQSSNGSFDTKRWIGFLFGFLRDPMVVAAAVGLGFVVGFWLFSISAMGTWVNLEGAQVIIAKIAIFAVFVLPIAGAICLCGIAVLTMSANRASKVLEWPFLRLSESIGDCMMVFASVMAASIPGGMLGVVSSSMNAHPMISAGFILLGIWGLTPIFLLCMIDNSSLFEPYSKAVIQSIQLKAEAWGAMYMQTAVAFVGFFMLMLMTRLQRPVGDFVLGLAVPLACFFLFGQYGVLAGRISDVTEIGFEGDFSDD